MSSEGPNWGSDLGSPKKASKIKKAMRRGKSRDAIARTHQVELWQVERIANQMQQESEDEG